MVKGYLDAVNNDGPEKLNMTQTVYDNSKKYLETTKEKIDTALLAYESKPVIADTKPLLAQAQTQTQTQTTCTNCSTNGAQENNYSADISAYVKGVFVE